MHHFENRLITRISGVKIPKKIKNEVSQEGVQQLQKLEKDCMRNS